MIQNPLTNLKALSIKIFTFAFLLSISGNIYAQKQVVSPIYANVSATIKGFYESLPIDYSQNSSKKYPLIIFLHGVGEFGNGSAAQLPKVKNNSGLAKLIDRGGFPTKFTVGGKDYSFIVIAPQLSGNTNYAQSVNDLIDYAIKHYRVDQNRIYLTGLSSGGGMTYDFIATPKDAARIAAALPICAAFSSTQAKADNISAAKMPVWMTVNNRDAASYPANTKDAISKLKAKYSTSTTPWITIFDKSGHDAWTKTYDPTFKQNGYNVYEWMLLHAKNISSAPVVVTNPPTAKVNANQTITLPTSSVTIDASASTAASGATITKYEWTKVPTSAIGTIATPGAAKTTVTGLTTAGTYVYQVKVTDNNGKTATAQVTITVKAAAAVDASKANAGSNQTITIPTRTATLNGSASTKGTGIKAYKWTLVSGPRLSGYITNETSVSTTVTELVPGAYTYRLSVTDNDNKVTTNDVVVTVRPRVGTLKADAGPAQTITQTSSLVLDGSGSTAPNNANFSSSWSKISGTTSSGAVINPSVNLISSPGVLQPGVYEYRLTVRDGSTSSTDVVKITVTGGATGGGAAGKTQANAGSNQTITIPTRTATLNGSASTNGNGIKAYKWTLVSGPRLSGYITNETSVSTTVTELVPGAYTYRLSVTDNDNKVTTNDVVVTVRPRVGTLKADAGPAQTITQTSSLVLDGSGSTAPNNANFSSSWSKISGTTSSGAVINPSVNLISSPGVLQPGVYEYRLTVRDGSTSSTDVVKITVTGGATGGGAAGKTQANAGSNQTITIPTRTATLNGSASTNGNGIKAYKWTLVSGPRLSGYITNETSVSTTVTELVPGAYTYRLSVTDNDNKVTTNDVVVTVRPRVGTLKADAGPAQTITQTSSLVLDGSGSTAPNNANFSSSWSKISGTTSSGAVINPSVNLISSPGVLQPGVYEYRLTVRDGSTTSTDVVKITVKATSSRIANVNETQEEPIVNANAGVAETLTVKINPNPVTTSMNVWVDGKQTGKTSIQVFSITGTLMLQKEFVKGAGLINQAFDVSSLPRGIYVIYVTLDGKEKKSVQMIKQ